MSTLRESIGCSGPRTFSFLRWVTRYVSKCDKRWIRFSKTVDNSRGGSRVNEAYLKIRARWYLVSRRRFNKHGKTVDCLRRRDRGIAADEAFFRKAPSSTGCPMVTDSYLTKRTLLTNQVWPDFPV